MNFNAFLGREPKDRYVARKVESFRTDYIRTHAFDNTKIDQTEFGYLTLETKFDAQDAYNRWLI